MLETSTKIIVFTIILVVAISFFLQQVEATNGTNHLRKPLAPLVSVQDTTVTLKIIHKIICNDENVPEKYLIQKKTSSGDSQGPFGPWLYIGNVQQYVPDCDLLVPLFFDDDFQLHRGELIGFIKYRVVATQEPAFTRPGAVIEVDLSNPPDQIDRPIYSPLQTNVPNILVEQSTIVTIGISPNDECEPENAPTSYILQKRTIKSGSVNNWINQDPLIKNTIECETMKNVFIDTENLINDHVQYRIFAQNDFGFITSKIIDVYLNPTVVVDPVIKKKGGGGCNDCVPPTLGLNKDGKRMVDDGFSYNGQAVNVESFYTDFPLINATVGEINHVKLKIYENQGIHNIKNVQLGLGVLEVGTPLSLSEVILQFELEYSDDITSLKELIITDKQNLIENNSTSISFDKVPCMIDSGAQCLFVDIEYSYREAPLYNVMVVHTSDSKRNNSASFLNDGVGVLGESLNEPPTHMLFNKNTSQQTEDLWLELVRIDRADNIWQDKYGYLYTFNDVKSWSSVTTAPILPDVDKPNSVMTRDHSDFIHMIQTEQDIAEEIFDERYQDIN